jgi:hypothetical protein
MAAMLKSQTGKACVLLSGDAEARASTWRASPALGLKRLSKVESTKRPELQFRALLTEGKLGLELASQTRRMAWN